MNLEKLNATRAIAVTRSDSVDLTEMAFSLYVGVGGTVTLTTKAGQTVTFVGVPTGSVLNVQTTRVWLTGTTADSIIGLS